MILFNIIQSDENRVEAISSFLIENGYALQTHIDVNSILTSNSRRQTIRLFFITKALLYSNIEKEIKEKYYSDDMIIYATPISHLNEEFSRILKIKVKAV
ncbi:MAG: hypothetical protein HY062_16960 [Bacteroidetes bacterium]|nr:hypothetical protein [Bacteroidota bacterium]